MTDSLSPSVVTTLESWRTFLNHVPRPPDLLSPDQRETIDRADRLAYDDRRCAYHAELPSLRTPVLTEIVTEGRMFVRLNRGMQGGTPCGMVVSGTSGVGKTTSLRELGRTVELAYRRRSPAADDSVPVVYITMPAGRHPKALPAEFLYFLGAAHGKRDSETRLTHQACQLMTDLHTSVVIIDEIHKLDRSRTGHDDQSDQLKYFMDHVPATFVLAGIDVERCGFFTGRRGRQLARRFTVIKAGPVGYSTTEQRADWHKLIDGFEGLLRLHDHKRGVLTGLADYLYGRTGGYITSLSSLVRRSAIRAIDDGSERITRKLLDSINLDHAATEEEKEPKPNAQRGGKASKRTVKAS